MGSINSTGKIRNKLLTLLQTKSKLFIIYDDHIHL